MKTEDELNALNIIDDTPEMKVTQDENSTINTYSESPGLSPSVSKTIALNTNTNLNDTLDSMMTRGADGLFKCFHCGKTSKTKQDIRRHIETHLEGVTHTCNNCGKVLRSSNALRHHVVKCI